MTKDKIRHVLKRLPYVLHLIKKGETQDTFDIAKRKEVIVIDEETKIIVEIFDEVMAVEGGWLKNIYGKLKKGVKDVYILANAPLSKGKYYVVKSNLVNKVYSCCIYKGLVSYKEILDELIR